MGFVMSFPGQKGRVFVTKLHFLYTYVNDYMKLGALKFWLDIPIKPQTVAHLTT